MPDPTLLAVLQHFASTPPAVVQPAQIIDAEPFISALEMVADDQDRELASWLARASVVQERMRASVAAKPDDFPSEMFDDLIARIGQVMEWELKVAAKRERRRHRAVSDRLGSLQERAALRARRRLAASDDLVLFLKAMRAEVDPDSRGGPTFTDPDEVERYILGSAA